jgi:predicted phosphodiesterase
LKKVLQYILRRPLVWLADRFSAAPKKDIVFASLSNLYASINTKNDTRVAVVDSNIDAAKFIVFSDQHKGDKSSADDFANNEENYIAALDFYHKENFTFINLGDSEELWKFNPLKILPINKKSLDAEKKFQPNRFYKTFGNHDLVWKNKADVFLFLRKYFAMPLQINEGIVLQLKNNNSPLQIFLTHGHQGDAMSDNNWLSTWLVAHIWMPLQRYLQINVNTPSKDFSLRNEHNIMMSEWSNLQNNVLLVTGHTHVPVFASGKYYNHPSNNIPGVEVAHVKPTYFNTGCCCYNDGDITGIEIAGGYIRLVKWHKINNGNEKIVLEEKKLIDLINDL